MLIKVISNFFCNFNFVTIISCSFQYMKAHVATGEFVQCNGGDEKDKLSRNAIQDGDLI